MTTVNKYCSTCLMTRPFVARSATLECPVCDNQLHLRLRRVTGPSLLNARGRRRNKFTAPYRRLAIAGALDMTPLVATRTYAD